jgi:hypothetical protein
MLAPNPISGPKAKQERRRLRQRRSFLEHKARVANNLAMYKVVVDCAVLDMLVRHRYLTDAETLNKDLVSKALTQALIDLAR